MTALIGYSPTGWQTKLPSRWQVKKLKYLASVNFSNVDKHTSDGEQSVRLCNYTDVYYNDVITDGLAFMKASASSDEIIKFALRGGDVLITKDSEMWNDIAVPAYVPADLDGVICGYHLAQVRPNPFLVNGKYLTYAFKTRCIRIQFHLKANGITRYGLSQDDVRSALFPLPPCAEQDAIVSFLETKEREIEAFIANKRLMIELLDEQKIAFVSRVITRSLNPNVPLKPSGVEWLGEIPKHWKIKRLKFLLRSKLAYGASEPSETDDPSYPRYLRITDFDEQGFLRPDTFRSLPPKIARNYLLTEGDVLFARSGATVGKAFLFTGYKGEACYAGYLIRAQADSRQLMSEYLFQYTQTGAFADWKNSSFSIATIQNISADKYSSLPVPLPPLDEQRNIIQLIEIESDRIARGIFAIQQEIKLMEDYRAVLIAAAVTGKIDVRQEIVSTAVAHAPNRHIARAVLSAEIVHQLHLEPTFGRVKHQKILHLCEYVARFDEIQGEYHRDAAGPFDNRLLYSVEAELKKQKWFEAYERERFGHGYRPLSKTGGHRKYFGRWWADKQPIIDKLIKLMRSWKTLDCEIFSTVYAAWNDLIVWGKQVTDDAILHEVLERWHESKKQVSEERWRKAIAWMRRDGFEPTGFGKATRVAK